MAQVKSDKQRGYYAQRAFDRGEYYQLNLVDTIPEFYLPDSAFSSVQVSYNQVHSNGKTSGMTACAEHPAFESLRKLLHNQAYIHMVTNSSNGDEVQQPFILNGHRFTTGDQFSCASAQGVTRSIEKRKQVEAIRARRKQFRERRKT